MTPGEQAPKLSLPTLPFARRGLKLHAHPWARVTASVSRDCHDATQNWKKEVHVSTTNARAVGMRLRLAVRQNLLAIGFVAGWLSVNAAVFASVRHEAWSTAIGTALCVTKASGGWPSAYQSFTELVVFGLVASMVASNVTRHYRPAETCRALAGEVSGHLVVVGMSNLGRRVVELAQKAGAEVVAVEEDPELLSGLVRAERPCVIGSPREKATLEAAAVRRAKVVVVASDDLESVAVACHHVRALNPDCELVLRCSDDDVGEVLAKAYRARVVSTSRLAAAFIQGQAVAARARAVVVIGDNTIATRVAAALELKRIAHKVVKRPVGDDLQALRDAGAEKADMFVVCDDNLGENLVLTDRLRDLNARARIVCRAFHDDAADLLGKPPFGCVVISTSRHAVGELVREGAFRELGITTLEPSAGPPQA